MAEHYIMTSQHQAENVADARRFLQELGTREQAYGLTRQDPEKTLVSEVQSAMTAIMVAALDLGIPAGGLVHAMGFSLGTYFAQCGVVDEGLAKTGQAIAAGVKAAEILVSEPEGRA
jgi:hypothetical protein